MFQRTLFKAMSVAVGALAVLAVKAVLDSREADKYDDDEEINFIRISDEDDEQPVYDASEKSSEVQELCAVYPYLNPDFVEATLADNAKYNEQYDADTPLSVTHSVHFSNSNAAEEFSQIMEEAGYICVERSDYAVAATKRLFGADGAITSDILNVANQTAALKGTYESCEIL
ncbi:MAG: hypothetical protein IJM63_06490 [Solobacterium sp.]|nr:hypothetical protein [Solobacterium sp.]MBQ9824129.1 hypothetical protein [Solobacterium sp.]